MRKSTVHGIILAAISVCLTMLGLELAVRIHRGKVLQFQSATAKPQNRVGRMAYHPRLGWIPRPGRASSDWTSNVDVSSVRSNGRSISTASRPILAVGDSFTFGDEVEDSETWAAHLEEILNKRVLNAGVGAYGIDQAFLRAELLLEKYDPDVVFLSFISDDIDRTEYSYYPYGRGWKPYFEYGDGSLILRNVPVPQEPAPRGSRRRFQTLRRALGYSFSPMPFSTGSPVNGGKIALFLSESTTMVKMSASTYSYVWTVSQKAGEANSSLSLWRQRPHRRQRPASEPCRTCERERRHGFGPFNGNAGASAQSVAESVPARWPLLPSNEPLGRRADRSILARNGDSLSLRTVPNRSVKYAQR